MKDIFHAGELAMQARTGVQQAASRIGKGIHPEIPPARQNFLREQRMVIVGSVDAQGRVWASLLTGKAGFMQAVDERTVQIDATPAPSDPLSENLRRGSEIGLLVINLATRQRIRVNGTVTPQPEGGLSVHTQQVYGNCPRYIQVRHTEELDPPPIPHVSQNSKQSSTLTEEQQRWIAQTDTFFVASFHGEGGADASHRGGNPGFVRVVNENTLVWPDYNGNGMFQTLGNLTANPSAGLLFVDFENGRTLQLTGQARILWDAEFVEKVVGAERLVEFHLDQVIEITATTPLRWRLMEYSPHNPA